MKQRLGIAYALLGKPELVFLDEPTNGLDPAGMAEVRELIAGLGKAGHTVVLSSHLLNEVEQVCDQVAILSRGELIAQGHVRELLSTQSSVHLKTTDDMRAAQIPRRTRLGFLGADRRGRPHRRRCGGTIGRSHACAVPAGGVRHRDGAASPVAGKLFPRSHRTRCGSGAGALMAAFTNVARWEGFKLRHRRMPWILLAIFLAFTQLAVWGSYFSYSAAVRSGGFMPIPAAAATRGMSRMIRCNDLRTKPSEVLPASVPPQAAAMLLRQCERQLVTRYQALLPTSSITFSLGVASIVGMVLIAILSASAFGAEFGLGTLRPILVRGVGRVSYLAGKFLVLAAAATGALLLATAAVALSALLISKMAVPPPTAVAVSGSWGDVLLMLVRVWASMLVFLTIASSITLLTRSTAAGHGDEPGLVHLRRHLHPADVHGVQLVRDGGRLPADAQSQRAGEIRLQSHARRREWQRHRDDAGESRGRGLCHRLRGTAVAVFRSRDVGGISGA